MNKNLKLSEAGIKFIHQFEGVMLKAYKDWVDAKGVIRYSIGYGHNGLVDGKKITPDLVITKEKAEELFKEDVKVFEDKVKQYIKVPLNQNQFDALVSLAYNVRTSNWVDFIERSKINSGNFDLVSEALMKYVVSDGKTLRGLIKRRTEEGKLFTTPVSTSDKPDVPATKKPEVTPPVTKPAVKEPVIEKSPPAKEPSKPTEKAVVSNKKPKGAKESNIAKTKPKEAKDKSTIQSSKVTKTKI